MTAPAFHRAAEAVSSIRPGAVTGAQFGPFFANGGQARGVHRIPAMLSKGEMVVNARSTGKFYSQLQAINAGVQPTYRQQGGTVNNTSVGDVIVQGASGEQAAHEILQIVNRELRRGVGRLKN